MNELRSNTFAAGGAMMNLSLRASSVSVAPLNDQYRELTLLLRSDQF